MRRPPFGDRLQTGTVPVCQFPWSCPRTSLPPCRWEGLPCCVGGQSMWLFAEPERRPNCRIDGPLPMPWRRGRSSHADGMRPCSQARRYLTASLKTYFKPRPLVLMVYHNSANWANGAPKEHLPRDIRFEPSSMAKRVCSVPDPKLCWICFRVKRSCSKARAPSGWLRASFAPPGLRVCADAASSRGAWSELSSGAATAPGRDPPGRSLPRHRA